MLTLTDCEQRKKEAFELIQFCLNSARSTSNPEIKDDFLKIIATQRIALNSYRKIIKSIKGKGIL